MNVKKNYPILYEAYKHYQQTMDRHFEFPPKNNDYLHSVLNDIPSLMKCGYIDNVSDNLLMDGKRKLSFSIVPTEIMSFDITSDGILFAESSRDN